MTIRRSEDDDLTVSPTGPAVPKPAVPGDSALLPGTRVHEFHIVKLLGEGGFGIVYLAHDESLDRTVALKEYMPSQLAERHGGTLSVQVRSQRHAEPFAAGLRSFINEARLLARFDHPSLLKVLRFFQANGTAYMAMPFYEGQTLKAVLRAMPASADEAWLRRLVSQLMDALEIIHGYECYHRDISPDNILMLPNDTPLLLDFGAARRVISDMTQTLTVILKPGYAPIEQYAEDPDMKQGPWTDIYALASVVYFALTREAPIAAIARAMNDRLVPLSQRMRGAYSENFLNTMDAALSLKPQDRPQSIAALRAMLAESDDALAAQAPAYASVPSIAAGSPAGETTRARGDASMQPATGPRSVPLSGAHADDATIAPVVTRAAPDSIRRLTIAGVVLAAPAVLAAVWWLTVGSPELVTTAEAPGAVKPAGAPVVNHTPVPAAAAQEGAPSVPLGYTPPQPPAAPVAVAPKVDAAPTKLAEPMPAPPRKPKAVEPPKQAALEGKSGVAAAPAPKVAPIHQPVETRPAPQSVQRVEEAIKAPSEPPPQQVARVEPKPEAPLAKSKPRAEEPPVEVARVEPKAPSPTVHTPALIGRYTGQLLTTGFPVGVTLVISSVENGVVSAAASRTGGACAGEYRMTGTYRDDTLRLRSTHRSGRAGDCTFGFRVAVKGTKLVGETGSGVPLELSR